MSDEAHEVIPEPKRPSRGRKAARWTFRGVWLLLAAPVIIVLLIPILLIGQEITAPSWIKERVESQAAEVLGGGSLSFGEITVTIKRDIHPRVRIRDAVLRDANGELLARIPLLEALVSPRGLIFQQEILPQEIYINGAEVGLRRGVDGTVAMAFNRTQLPSQRATTLIGLLDSFDQAFEITALSALRSVRIDGIILNYEDARAGRSWIVDDGRVLLTLNDQETVMDADMALLSGRDFITTLELNYVSPRGQRQATVALSIEDVPAADIATQNPALSWLSVLDAQVSASLRASVDNAGELGPVFATLEIGKGALRPDAGARAVGFDAAKTYLRYDPGEDQIRFEQLEIESDWGSLQGQGQAYLRDLDGGLPQALLGQFQIDELSVNPDGLFPESLNLISTFVDFRMRIDPFIVEVGQFGTQYEHTQVLGDAVISASPDGWDLAVDVQIDAFEVSEMLQLWPEEIAVPTRNWVVNNVLTGSFSNANLGFRKTPGDAPVLAISQEFQGATVKFMRLLPPIQDGIGSMSLIDGGFHLWLEEGGVTVAEGQRLDLAGSVFSIPQVAQLPAQAEISLHTESSINAALTLLDMAPFGFMSRANLGDATVSGTATVRGEIALPLIRALPINQVEFEMSAALRNVETASIVPSRVLAARNMTLNTDGERIEIRGQMRLDGLPMTARWAQEFGTTRSSLTAEVELSERALSTFNIGLPNGMLSGSGTGNLRIDLRRGSAPEFQLSSDLVGIALRFPALGWSKGANARGNFEIGGVLGQVPRIDRLLLDVAGLRANGTISLKPGGGLDRARFNRVRLGGWLDAAVDLVGRGAGRPVGIELRSGSLDLRRANFGAGGSGGGPMSVALNLVQVSDGIALHGFRGNFDGNGGFNGRFTARLNGTAGIEGVIAPVGNRSGMRILSSDAGAVLSAAGLLETAVGGALDMTLSPTGGAGSYDGVLKIANLRVRDAPALAALLDAISVVGLLQQLDGQGLSFTTVDARFRLSPDQIVVTQASAVGPGLGLSVDGIYTMADKVMDFQGVISPLFLINGVGSVLTRPGEGLFGFNFTLRGGVGNARVRVNPLSVLTPGMFREIFRRPVPVVE